MEDELSGDLVGRDDDARAIRVADHPRLGHGADGLGARAAACLEDGQAVELALDLLELRHLHDVDIGLREIDHRDGGLVVDVALGEHVAAVGHDRHAGPKTECGLDGVRRGRRGGAHIEGADGGVGRHLAVGWLSEICGEGEEIERVEVVGAEGIKRLASSVAVRRGEHFAVVAVTVVTGSRHASDAAGLREWIREGIDRFRLFSERILPVLQPLTPLGLVGLVARLDPKADEHIVHRDRP